MFDWNDQDQTGDTIWGEFNESEDHIVPNAKGTKENTIFTFGDYNKKQKNEDASSVARSTEQTSAAKGQLLGSNVENSSSFSTNEELSAPRLDMDTWPDLPSFSVSNAENSTSFSTNEELSAPRLDMDTWPDLPSFGAGLSKVYNGGSDRDSLETALMDDLSQASNLNKVRGQLVSGPEYLGNEHDDKDSNSFLDCDWANIGDFDDLDRIFRNNQSIFGHEMVANVDEFLSPSTDVIVGTEQSIPIPDMPLGRDEPSHQVAASFQFAEHSGGKSKTEEKTADSTVENREGAFNQAHLISEHWGMHSQFLIKLDATVRLCIRDSLFRLARSARERQSASDRRSTNKSTRDEDKVLENEEINTTKSGMELHDAEVETYTNPVDRTVVHLLFHTSPESGATKDEIPQTPTSCNSLPKVYVNIPQKCTPGRT